MICFKDKTFCSASKTVCDKQSCYRFWTEEDQEDYDRWSELFTEDGGPVAIRDFSYDCEYYRDKFLTAEEKLI